MDTVRVELEVDLTFNGEYLSGTVEWPSMTQSLGSGLGKRQIPEGDGSPPASTSALTSPL